jgi:hypothetical protein
MSEKSYVSLEQGACLVCGRPYDTGSILLDLRLLASMRQYTVTDWKLCPEHLVLHDEGYVALVECDPKKSGNPRAGDTVLPENVCRTGPFAHLRREVFLAIFNRPVAPNQPCMYVGPGVIQKLQNIMQHPQ